DTAAVVKALIERYRIEKDIWTRTTILFALGRLGSSSVEAVPLVREALKDAEVVVRFHAAAALAGIVPKDAGAAAPGLLELLKPENRDILRERNGRLLSNPRPLTEPALRNVVIRALYHADPEEAVRAGIPHPFFAGGR